ncbi:MAG TPA: glycosyltransferase family A protein [Gemmatimonadaceae bacterium]
MIDMSTSTTMPTAAPALSVVLVAGGGLAGIARTMRHLRAQTARDRIELIVVAESAHTLDCNALGGAVFAACRVVEVGPITQRGDAAAKGIRAATAPIVAMIEDHSYPEPEWAEAFLRAHAGPWTVVGPVVANANPDYVASWVNYVLSYGIFAPPVAGGERDLLPWHNSAYKREALLPFGDRLGALLEWEGWLQGELRATGHTMYLEPTARTHHANVSRGWSTVGLNAQRGRILGAQRATREQWPYWRRIVQAAAFPLFPLLQLRYALPAVRRMSIPDALRPRVYASLGATLGVLAAAEAWGLLTGEGNAISRMEDYELHRTRHLSRRERRDLEARERAVPNAG